MSDTGLSVLLRTLRERRDLSLREVSRLSEVDHAYIYRLETGDKTSPSADILAKLLRVLRADDRETEIAQWLASHDARTDLVAFALTDATFTSEMFMAAAGIRHRGAARPELQTLVERVKALFKE